SPTCVLSAIVDPSPAAEDLARSAGVPLYESLEALLARERPDGVVLATPNALHVEHAMLCVAARLPMLLEKPITPTVQEGERLVVASEQAGVKVLIGHHRAHSPIMLRAKEVIDS